MVGIPLRGGSRWARGLRGQIGGTAIGQAATVAAVLVLSRLYAPEDFGRVTILVSYLAVFAIVSGLGYEQGIVPARDEEGARGLARLALVTGTGLAVIGAVVVLFEAVVIRAESLSIGVIVGGAALVGGLGIALNGPSRYLVLREGDTAEIGRALRGQGVGKAGTQVTLGLAGLGAAGLAIGEVAGRLAGVRRLQQAAGLHPVTELREGIREWRSLLTLALRERPYFLYSLPSLATVTVALMLPGPTITAVFGAEAGGHYSFADRMLGLPLGLVSAALADAFFARAGRLVRRSPAHARPILVSVAWKALPAVGVVALLVALLAPRLAGPLLGSRWTPAGELAAQLAPLYFLNFMYAPVSRMAIVLGRQRQKLAWDFLLLVSGYAVLTSGPGMGWDLARTIWWYVGVQALVYLTGFLLLARWTTPAALRVGAPTSARRSSRSRCGPM
jgi:O-antigen/teichoic acid export membrane protein